MSARVLRSVLIRSVSTPNMLALPGSDFWNTEAPNATAARDPALGQVTSLGQGLTWPRRTKAGPLVARISDAGPGGDPGGTYPHPRMLGAAIVNAAQMGATH